MPRSRLRRIVSLLCASILAGGGALFIALEIAASKQLPGKAAIAPGFVLFLGLMWIYEDVKDWVRGE